ncbi:MAG: hydroxyacid dehydrogenase [Hyphomicrobiaceae bacterium]|nr:hydroxyacid dehydrogenase [Hyphomicrobiaceae bacterium]
MPDIVITEFMDEEPVEDLKAAGFTVHWDKTLCEKPDEIKALIPNSVALIVRNRTPVDDDLLSAGPNLKVLGRLGVGLDNIDTDACEKHGVTVCPATGSNNVSVAEYAICAAMMLLRGSFYAKDDVLAGKWPRNDNVGLEARGRTLGLLGFGMIGQSAARMARGLEMEIIAHDPHVPADADGWQYAESVSQDDLFARSDILSVHTPLLPETRNLIDAGVMKRMKRGAFLINTARGGIINEDDLVAALKSGQIGGAALDVFAKEPLSRKDAAKFADVPNLIMTPHISGVTEESSAAISRITVDNVLRVLGEKT